MQLRKHLPTVLIAMIVAAVTAGGPAIADGVRHALFAHNSDKVDGRHAVGPRAGLTKAKGKLDAHNKAGKLPAKFIPKVNASKNADKLGGRAGSGLTRTASTATGTTFLIGTDFDPYGSDLTIQAPAAGFVVVTGGSSYSDIGCTTDNGCWVQAHIKHVQTDAISQTMGSAASTAEENEFFSTPLTAVFPVDPGTNTFQILIRRAAGNGQIRTSGMSLSAIYSPFGPTGNTP
jgi:hypothetical protein